MATPKKRKSLTRRKRARAQDKIVLPNIVKCSNCDNFKLQHRMCTKCGFYKGKVVIQPKIKTKTKAD